MINRPWTRSSWLLRPIPKHVLLGRASPGCYGPILIWVRDHPKGRRTQAPRENYNRHTLPKAPRSSKLDFPVVDHTVSGAPYS